MESSVTQRVHLQLSPLHVVLGHVAIIPMPPISKLNINVVIKDLQEQKEQLVPEVLLAVLQNVNQISVHKT